MASPELANGRAETGGCVPLGFSAMCLSIAVYTHPGPVFPSVKWDSQHSPTGEAARHRWDGLCKGPAHPLARTSTHYVPSAVLMFCKHHLMVSVSTSVLEGGGSQCRQESLGSFGETEKCAQGFPATEPWGNALLLRQGPWPAAGGVGSVWRAEAGCVVPWLGADAAAGAAPVSARFPASGWV